MMRTHPLLRLVPVAFLGLVLIAPASARAQNVVAPVEQMDFARPESWALSYFTSNTLLTGLAMPDGRTGAIDVGLELAWIPELSARQQRIGYNGTKQEDLNKAPMFARPRLTLGLPGQFSLTIAGVPPVEMFGITPRLFAAALGRPIVTGDTWGLGARVSAQAGTAKSAFTCPEDVLAYPPGDPQNSYGCRSTSSDVATLRYVTGEIDLWHTLSGARGLTPHATFSVNRLDSVFQVDALTFDFHDKTELRTHGTTVAFGGGVEYPLTDRIRAAVDVFYSPLSVRRPPATSTDREGLLNARGLLTYRIR